MTSWYCQNCILVDGKDCGPWDDGFTYFINIRRVHNGHPGFQIGQPTPLSNYTEVEQLFTEYFCKHYSEWFHNLVAKIKGPTKICLRKDKLKWEKITWMS